MIKRTHPLPPVSSGIRGFVFAGVLLSLMAVADWYFSQQLKAEVRNAVRVHDFVPMVASPAAIQDTESDIHMVEQALNSRYMQWGAVGVMLMLFVWIVMKHAPAQERRRDAERKEEREAYLASLQQRDEIYLEQIREIRGSVETHTRDVIASKDRLAGALQDLRVALAKKGE